MTEREKIARATGVKIGSNLKLHLEIGEAGKNFQEGTVVWIHPEWRFFIAQFNINGNKIYQSYNFDAVKGIRD